MLLPVYGRATSSFARRNPVSNHVPAHMHQERMYHTTTDTDHIYVCPGDNDAETHRIRATYEATSFELSSSWTRQRSR